MQQCHGKDKAATSATPYHAKGKAAASAMHKAATMRPKHVFADENIPLELLPPPDVLMQLLRAKETPDTRSSCKVSRKRLGKERSPSPSIGSPSKMSQHRGGNVDTGSIPRKHDAKDKTCPPHQLQGHTQVIQQPVKTEARLAGQMSKKRGEKLVETCLSPQKNKAKEMSCPSDQLRRHMQGIQQPVKTEARLAREMSLKQREKVDTCLSPQKNKAKEMACPSDQLCRHTQGIQWPVKTEARLAGEMSLKRREKVDTGLIPHKHNAKEMACPSDQLRRHTQGIQRPVKTEARLSRDKTQTKGNTSCPTKRTTPLLKSRTSSCSSHKSTSRPIDAHDHGNSAAIQKQKEESAAAKMRKYVDDIIQNLNKLGLGEDIDFEEFYGYLQQLPLDQPVNTFTELDGTDRFDMDLRHAVYRIKSYKLLKKESKNELCCDELKNCPMDLLDKDELDPDFLVKMKYFIFFQYEGVLDWFFHRDFCKLACLNDYQRLVPRDHGNGKYGEWEYADWDEYRSCFHSYEMQHEYIEYFETLLRELKWLKDCLPFDSSSPIGSKIWSRGTHQATKIATRFSKITSHLVRIGFNDCVTYMSIEASWCDGSDGLFFEIWKRVTQQKESFEDALKEVYKLNKCPSRQDSMEYAIEHDHSIMKQEFLRCTAVAGITKEVPVDKAQELIAEAVKKLRVKPKFYDGYIRKKIEVARSIGLIEV